MLGLLRQQTKIPLSSPSKLGDPQKPRSPCSASPVSTTVATLRDLRWPRMDRWGRAVGPAYQAILAQPSSGTMNGNRIRSRQGECWRRSIPLPGAGALQLETMTTAVLQNSLVSTRPDYTPAGNAADGRCGASSRLALPQTRPTTIRILGSLFPAGSPRIEEISKLPDFHVRPAAAQSGQDLSSLRAIDPWCFGWTKQPLSVAELGLGGRALQEELDSDPGHCWSCWRLRLYQRWPFFRMLYPPTVEMTLSKVDLDLGPSLR